MASTTLAARTEASQLDMGWVVRSTFQVVGRRFGALVVLALPFVFIPQALTGFLPAELNRLGTLANLPALIFDGAATLLACRQLSGAAALPSGEALRAGMRRFGALWGLAIVSGLAILLGAILLLVPGVVLLLGWLPANAVLMAEEKTVFASLDRAWALTRGARWRLAGLVGLFLVGLVPASVVVFIADTATLLLGGERLMNRLSDFVWNPLFVTAFSIFGAVGTAAVYAALLRAKEGGGADIAKLFD